MRRPSLISRVRSCISPGNKLSTRPFIYLFSTVSASRKCFTLVPDVNYSTVKYRACRSRMTRYSMPGRSACVRCRHMICNNDVFVCACDQRGDFHTCLRSAAECRQGPEMACITSRDAIIEGATLQQNLVTHYSASARPERLKFEARNSEGTPHFRVDA